MCEPLFSNICWPLKKLSFVSWLGCQMLPKIIFSWSGIRFLHRSHADEESNCWILVRWCHDVWTTFLKDDCKIRRNETRFAISMPNAATNKRGAFCKAFYPQISEIDRCTVHFISQIWFLTVNDWAVWIRLIFDWKSYFHHRNGSKQRITIPSSHSERYCNTRNRLVKLQVW